LREERTVTPHGASPVRGYRKGNSLWSCVFVPSLPPWRRGAPRLYNSNRPVSCVFVVSLCRRLLSET
jgi:hypothetical protein